MAQLSQFAGRYTEVHGILGTGSHCYRIVRLTSAATPHGVMSYDKLIAGLGNSMRDGSRELLVRKIGLSTRGPT
jgi:hypothetical protein